MLSWKILYKNGKKLNSQSLQTILLKNRGIVKSQEKKFLDPDISTITPKSVGIDLEEIKKAIERLRDAQKRSEKVIIFGDYDVDGITGTALLWENLKIFLDVLPYLPDRIEEGYGLSIPGIKNLLKKYPDTKLIITVDNGIVANEAVDFARSQGIDVVITDHHTPGTKNPKSRATIHTINLCGCGVAYVFAKEVLKSISNKEISSSYLELVALATVADLVPLLYFNRTLLKFGLEELRKTQRIGLLELFSEAAIKKEEIDPYQIGHIIAPRINATGRIGDAMDSLRLICTKDPNRARILAKDLGDTNRERQRLTVERVLHAKERVNGATKKLIFVSHESYEPGIIGLVAGRLTEEFYKPSIVLSVGPDFSKASARSISGFNIISFIREAREFLIDAGGHPMAAGFTVQTVMIPKLQEKLEALAEQKLTKKTMKKVLRIDCFLPLTKINYDLYSEIERFSPFGMGNPEPTFAAKGVILSDIRIVGLEQKHIKIKCVDGESTFDGIYFRGVEKIGDIKLGEKVDLAYSIEENVWNDKRKLELRIKDMKKS